MIWNYLFGFVVGFLSGTVATAYAFHQMLKLEKMMEKDNQKD